MNPGSIISFLYANSCITRIWDPKRHLIISLAGAAYLLLPGCSSRNPHFDPPIPEVEAFSESGTEPLDVNWWKAFEDPVLDSLVGVSLSANLDLQARWEGFQAARYLGDREAASQFPQLSLFVNAETSRPQQTGEPGEEIRAGFAAAYELDLWGRIRNQVRAERFRARAALFDHQAAAMTLSAETGITWLRILTAREQLDLAEEQSRVNKDILDLIQARFASGLVRAVDMLRQEQLLLETRTREVFYNTQVAVLRHQLFVLLGQPPQQSSELPQATYPELPPLPETGLPLELVRRRPDVRKAYQLVLAADQDLAAAIRAKYPRISLDLTGAFEGDGGTDLFRNWAYSLAGELLAPLFYGGSLKAEAKRTRSLRNQQLYQYGQVVLTAFREVEDALIQEQRKKEHIRILQKQLDLAKQTEQQLQAAFLHGMSDYLDVLLSLDARQQLQRDLLNSRQELFEIRISLYRALAGGLPLKEEPEPQ